MVSDRVPTIAPMELDALIRALVPSDVIGRRPVEITELAHDTRHVREGAMFFCVPGAHVASASDEWRIRFS